jgi:hypothetical protein
MQGTELDHRPDYGRAVPVLIQGPGACLPLVPAQGGLEFLAEPVQGSRAGHDCQTSPHSPHSSTYPSARSPVVMRISLMVSVLPQAGQAAGAGAEAVKSATVAYPSLPMQSAQSQYPEVVDHPG